MKDALLTVNLSGLPDTRLAYLTRQLEYDLSGKDIDARTVSVGTLAVAFVTSGALRALIAGVQAYLAREPALVIKIIHADGVQLEVNKHNAATAGVLIYCLVVAGRIKLDNMRVETDAAMLANPKAEVEQKWREDYTERWESREVFLKLERRRTAKVRRKTNKERRTAWEQRGDLPVEQHRIGSILWALPRRMRVGQRERVEIRLGDAGVAESQLRAGLKGRGFPETDKLEVAPLMRVTLVSDAKDFEISSLSSPDQYVRPNSVARWDFYATPLRSGTRTLRILVSMRVKIESKDEIVDLPSYERDVIVAVALFHSTAKFMSKNWQWAAGTVLIPLLIWAATKTDAGSVLLKQVIGGFSAK